MSSVRQDYEKFFSLYGQKNPSDINTRQKYQYAVSIGWSRLRAMQSARKRGEEFTKLEYWKNNE